MHTVVNVTACNDSFLGDPQIQGVKNKCLKNMDFLFTFVAFNVKSFLISI